MTWNYRVLKADVVGQECFAIHEVYYDKDGVPHSCTVNDVGAGNQDSVEGIKEVLLMMLRACEEPVLEFEGLGTYLSDN